jgi:ankyrin repeat protein
MQENPGRQSISGSFNPIDEGEWAEQAYIGQTERFFAAVAADDRISVAALLNEGADPNRRDHVGRAPLHVAILARAENVAGMLVDAGARMTARLVDGRSALHLAAQVGMGPLMRKMFFRSELNRQKAEEEAEKKAKGGSDDGMDVDEPAESDSETARASSEDDWSSDSDDERAVVKKADADTPDQAASASGEVPEDSEDEPDVFDVNLPDWDLAFIPLEHAVAAGSLDALGELLARGADPLIVTKSHGYNTQAIHALTLTGLLEDKDEASRIATRLLMAGASCSTADENSLSILHRLVRMNGNASLVATVLRNDLKARKVFDAPYFDNSVAVYPLVSAVDRGDWAMAAGELTPVYKVAGLLTWSSRQSCLLMVPSGCSRKRMYPRTSMLTSTYLYFRDMAVSLMYIK